jgi:membrane-bound lytic murein transglycosylase D
MQKTLIFVKRFLATGFIKHLVGLAAFVLFALTIMSFRLVGKAGVKKTLGSDSTANTNANKAFANLLSNPVAANRTELKQVFKMNPQVTPFYKEYSRKEAEEYGDMKVWGKPYFDLLDRVLAENNLPLQLKYLCVIESNLKAATVSHSGATGPWQLMRDEGRMYGLVMTKGNDERKDFEKSTYVAAGLFKSLYNQYGDWLLAIAAYNCGTGAMRRAIAHAGSKNYWVVQKYLTEQARNYIKKYISTYYIFEGCGGWTTVTNDEAVVCSATMAKIAEQSAGLDSTTANNTTTVEISGKYNSAIMINSLFMEAEVFNRLNPNLDNDLLQGKTYHLTLPTDRMPLFQANRRQILEQSVQILLASAAK